MNMEFTIVFVWTLLVGANLRSTAYSQPGFSDLSSGVLSPVLLFAVNSCIWMAATVFQVLFRFLLYDRFYRNQLLSFIDILSVSNISLLVFDQFTHGYYIHGRTVHAFADTDMDELNQNLRREENDLVPRRGLNDTAQQSFEIFVTAAFRQTFDKIHNLIVNKSRSNKLTSYLSNCRGFLLTLK